MAIPPQSEEQRASPRGPSGSSFVPGLVHELRNFIFGISGSLDAMGIANSLLHGVAEDGKFMARLDVLCALAERALLPVLGCPLLTGLGRTRLARLWRPLRRGPR